MLIAFDKYCLKEKIGEGNFGQVFQGYNTRTREKVAIKVEPIKYELKLLKNEAKIYQFLQNTKGIPKVKWFGSDENNYYMVMELFSMSLEDKRREKGGKFSLALTLSIGSQVLDILECIHSKGIIHRDIKPENFMLNFSLEKVYLIDFGFCRTFRNIEGEHIPESKISSLIGSPKFASIHAHDLCELSRRDDLESMAYMLCYFFLGFLEASPQFKKFNLLEIVPPSLKTLLSKIQSLAFDEEPDYFALKQIIK